MSEEPPTRKRKGVPLQRLAAKGARFRNEKEKDAKYFDKAKKVAAYRRLKRRLAHDGVIAEEQKQLEPVDDAAPPAKRAAGQSPFAREIRLREQRREEAAKRRAAHEARQQAALEKQRQRNRKHAKLTQRTRKGQPIMRNLMESMLEKLKTGQ